MMVDYAARKCKKHPRYKGLREPRSDCEDCLDIYFVDGIEDPPTTIEDTMESFDKDIGEGDPT